MSDEYFNKNAKKDCKECKGLGMVTYFFAEDWTETVACLNCFPNNKEAKDTARRWHKVCEDNAYYDEVFPV